LIAQIQEKRAAQLPMTQNVQMMRSEPNKEDPKVNMVLKSGTAIGVNGQNPGGDKGTYREAWGSFVEVSTPGNRDQPKTDKDP